MDVYNHIINGFKILETSEGVPEPPKKGEIFAGNIRRVPAPTLQKSYLL